MEIYYYKEVDSTQEEVKRRLANKPERVAVVANTQTQGIGSRNNRWESVIGNLYLSFALPIHALPKDLPLQSSSLYFGFLFKSALESLGSKAWLKWPNDIYLDCNKIGGIITQIDKSYLICGIGLNLISQEKWEKIDLKIEREIIIKTFFNLFEKMPNWDDVFMQYSVEFEKSRSFNTHANNDEVSLSGAKLCIDGSLTINGQKVYSLR